MYFIKSTWPQKLLGEINVTKDFFDMTRKYSWYQNPLILAKGGKKKDIWKKLTDKFVSQFNLSFPGPTILYIARFNIIFSHWYLFECLQNVIPFIQSIQFQVKCIRKFKINLTINI